MRKFTKKKKKKKHEPKKQRRIRIYGAYIGNYGDTHLVEIAPTCFKLTTRRENMREEGGRGR